MIHNCLSLFSCYDDLGREIPPQIYLPKLSLVNIAPNLVPQLIRAQASHKVAVAFLTRLINRQVFVKLSRYLFRDLKI